MRHKLGARAGTAVAATVLVLGGILAGTGNAWADQDLPSCLDHTWSGPDGYIAIRASPDGRLAWTAKDYTDNDGVWNVYIYVNKTLFDAKLKYAYNPHGSIPPSYAKKGSIVSFVADHVDSKGHASHNVPNGCIVP